MRRINDNEDEHILHTNSAPSAEHVPWHIDVLCRTSYDMTDYALSPNKHRAARSY